MTDTLTIARCHLIAAEGAYMAAKRRHQPSKAKRRAWVLAKARVAALEGSHG